MARYGGPGRAATNGRRISLRGSGIAARAGGREQPRAFTRREQAGAKKKCEGRATRARFPFGERGRATAGPARRRIHGSRDVTPPSGGRRGPVAPYWLSAPPLPSRRALGSSRVRLPRPDRRPGGAASPRLGPPSEPGRRGLSARRRTPSHGVLSLPAHAATRAHSPGLASPGARRSHASAAPLHSPAALSAGADGAPRDSLRSVPLPRSTVRLAAALACLPSARRPRDRGPRRTRTGFQAFLPPEVRCHPPAGEAGGGRPMLPWALVSS